MADEIIDIVDEKNQIVGQERKSIAHKEGLWHRASHVWIFNDKGEVLIQHRAKNKPLYPDLLDISAAGHIPHGGDSLETAVNEAEEELGLKIDRDQLELIAVRKQPGELHGGLINNEFYYVYFLRYNGPLDNFVLQEEEVEGLEIKHIDDLAKDIKENPSKYVPHTNGYYDFVVDTIKDRLLDVLK